MKRKTMPLHIDSTRSNRDVKSSRNERYRCTIPASMIGFSLRISNKAITEGRERDHQIHHVQEIFYFD